jgi:putative two-component system response regulator
MRRVIRRMVSATGHPVETAAGATEAREWLAAASFSLVICDVQMPGESGSDLARWIRATQPDVAIVMATGTNDAELADETLAFGAYGFLVKPFKRNEVAINIANALRRRRLEIENREHRQLLEERVDERTAALRDAVRRLEIAREELKRSREETISRLSLAIEFRSNETGAHVARIGVGAQCLGRRLGFDESWCEMIRVSAVLHDVGKIGIPDGILLSPVRSPPTSAAACRSTPRSATGCSRTRASSCSTSRRGSPGRITSGSTERGTRAASPARRSRSRAGSPRSPTSSTR